VSTQKYFILLVIDFNNNNNFYNNKNNAIFTVTQNMFLSPPEAMSLNVAVHYIANVIYILETLIYNTSPRVGHAE
jgi:hypothetical protein